MGIALVGAVVFSAMPRHPGPADYVHGFLVSTLINLGMPAIASPLIFRIPKGRGSDPVPRAEPVLEAWDGYVDKAASFSSNRADP